MTKLSHQCLYNVHILEFISLKYFRLISLINLKYIDKSVNISPSYPSMSLNINTVYRTCSVCTYLFTNKFKLTNTHIHSLSLIRYWAYYVLFTRIGISVALGF